MPTGNARDARTKPAGRGGRTETAQRTAHGAPADGGAPVAPRETFTFFHRHRVRWAEVDLQEIVFNPRYFEYFDTAITEYMRAAGFAYPAGLTVLGADFFAVDAQATFRGSARFDDDLEIGVRVARLGRTSTRFELAVLRRRAGGGDEVLVTGVLVYVAAGGEPRASVPLPPAFVDAVLALERVAPARAG